MEKTDKLLLTQREAAAVLSLSERTVWELRRRGELHPLKVGAALRYPLDDLRRWIAEKQQTTSSVEAN